jgi:Holliday junction resolvasome RuvABC endonuclease subunit
MKNRIVAGIDYSLTCPCVAIYNEMREPFCFENISFFFLTSRKTLEGRLLPNVFGGLLTKGEWSSEEHRYYIIANNIITAMGDANPVYIEGYSMGSTGRVFNIAENTAVLKHLLWMKGINIASVPPTTVKKYATGKGNANKEKMYRSFSEETGTNLKEILQPKKEDPENPLSDIVDAYYILKYGLNND